MDITGVCHSHVPGTILYKTKKDKLVPGIFLSFWIELTTSIKLHLLEMSGVPISSVLDVENRIVEYIILC